MNSLPRFSSSLPVLLLGFALLLPLPGQAKVASVELDCVGITSGEVQGLAGSWSFQWMQFEEVPTWNDGAVAHERIKVPATWIVSETASKLPYPHFGHATYTIELRLDRDCPQEMGIDFNEKIPSSSIFSAEKRKSLDLAKNYMGLSDNQELSDLDFDKVFIGSCTNSRIEDLREAAEVLKGQKVSENIQEAIVVPGSGMVKEQAEKEGIHKIFIDAGFQWRAPGCSMCLGMNPDQLSPYERCASTSNRNFEGRQGNLGRTHLMSPKMAALTAINGRIVKEI